MPAQSPRAIVSNSPTMVVGTLHFSIRLSRRRPHVCSTGRRFRRRVGGRGNCRRFRGRTRSLRLSGRRRSDKSGDRAVLPYLINIVAVYFYLDRRTLRISRRLRQRDAAAVDRKLRRGCKRFRICESQSLPRLKHSGLVGCDQHNGTFPVAHRADRDWR